jgi:hypothetical protein
MDRRWQLVLDCLGAEEPPFSKGTLAGFRERLIEQDLDRRLAGRTWSWRRAPGVGARALRAALGSSPLWGAGRVEDTRNLMGHALHKARGVIAAAQGGAGRSDCDRCGAGPGCRSWRASSLKAALNLGWDDPAARDQALAQAPAAAVLAGTHGQRLPVNGQMVGRCSGGGVRRRGGWLRSRKSVSGLAAASRRVSAGRFHFSSMVARIEVWS